jgi:DnaJ-domain-containing protein 1
MTDAFALLNEPRRPWLEADALKQTFLSLSNEVHPDRIHSASETEKERVTSLYAELNAAHNTLREPRDRLLHLLELEAGAKPSDIQRIPPGTMDLFAEVGQLCRDVDAFLAQRANVTSPLLKVQTFERGLEWTDKLQGLQQRINTKRDELTGELQRMNAQWESAPAIGSPQRRDALPLERLEQIYRVFSYIARWSEQIRERHVQLTAGAF